MGIPTLQLNSNIAPVIKICKRHSMRQRYDTRIRVLLYSHCVTISVIIFINESLISTLSVFFPFLLEKEVFLTFGNEGKNLSLVARATCEIWQNVRKNNRHLMKFAVACYKQNRDSFVNYVTCPEFEENF